MTLTVREPAFHVRADMLITRHDVTMTGPNPAWHRGYDEGRAAADQEFAVCAPPDEYDSLQATEFMAGWHTALGHNSLVTSAKSV